MSRRDAGHIAVGTLHCNSPKEDGWFAFMKLAKDIFLGMLCWSEARARRGASGGLILICGVSC